MASPVFLFVGRTKEGFIKEGIEKYAALIGRYVPLDIREIKGASVKEAGRAVEEEADSVLKRLAQSDFVVALDERGRNLGSVALAGELGRVMESGRRAVFVVGGPFGLSERVRARADMVLSLSGLTFTHEMARLILAEQFYRALTIIKGKTYHY
jgi:23S rRNA (pseudouridine1915-N3)-methyltransferase